jgi:FkbM family methyltransferase
MNLPPLLQYLSDGPLRVSDASASAIQAWHRSKLIRHAVYRSLRAEILFNLDLLSECNRRGADQRDASKLLSKLEMRSLDLAEANLMGLVDLFRDAGCSRAPIVGRRGYLGRSRNIRRRSQLFLRMYHRVRIEQFRAQSGHSCGDLGYLRYLLKWALDELDAHLAELSSGGFVANASRRITAAIQSRLPVDFLGMLGWSVALGPHRIALNRSRITLARWVDPADREDEYRGIAALASLGDTYVDVGANVGLTLLAAKRAVRRCGNPLRIVGFEPNPWLFTVLRQNLQSNVPGLQNCELFECAVGAAAGTGWLCGVDDRGKLGSGRRGTKVSVRTLDDALGEATEPCIGLLKIDVEGGEAGVLRGSTRLLPLIRAVQFEVSPGKGNCITEHREDPCRILLESGFSLFLRHRNELRSFDPSRSAHRDHFNILALREPNRVARALGWTLIDDCRP